MLVALVLTSHEAKVKAAGLTEGHLPIPPWGYGLAMFGLFLCLLGLTFAFKSIGKRH